MSPKRNPSEEEFAMLDAMFSLDPDVWNAWLVSQGHEPFLDLPECLALIPKDQWSVNTKILPTPGVQKYLDTGDTLTYHTIEMMERAMERDYQVEAPWYIMATVPFCKEGDDPVVEDFRLGRET
jgi:hypothetical protein